MAINDIESNDPDYIVPWEYFSGTCETYEER